MRLGRAALWGLLASCLSLPVIGAVLFRLYSGPINEKIEQYMGWLQSMGPSAWVALALLQALIALSGILPASVLGVAAGVVYGVKLGFVLTAIGTMLGAAAAFGLARTTLRPLIQRRFGHRPYLARLDHAIERRGWRTVCLLRFSPVMPFAVGSYALGLTSITFWRYWIGSIAALPALLGYVVLGSIAKHSVSSISGGARPFQLVLMGVGISATVWFLLHFGKIAKDVLGDDEHIAEGFGDE